MKNINIDSTTLNKDKSNAVYFATKCNFKEVAKEELMKERIINVLLICSHYDAFMLEEDGRINEKIFIEYTSKSLRYPPRFTHASSARRAIMLLKKEKFDLVITMLNVGKIDVFDMARKVKNKYPEIPIVTLVQFSREVALKLEREDLSAIDHVFCWLGNTSLLLAIIKLLEDKMNAHNDVKVNGIQAILLVEDSIRFYSSYLPIIYQVIFDQSLKLMNEGFNEHQKTTRMRERPKILLAKTFEEAVELYKDYKEELLGVISDISYSANGKMDKEAGLKLAELIRSENPNMPILLQSSDKWAPEIMNKLKISFLNKYSKTLLVELKNYIKDNYGFGDFIFRDPFTGAELARAKNVKDLQHKMETVDIKSLMYHANHNQFSKWLKARALFSVADLIAPWSRKDFKDDEEHRHYLVETISNYRRIRGRGIIANKIDEYIIFSRLGEGQLGGKGRGLAFIDSFIQKHNLMYKWDNILVSIPRTLVLTTDIFDDFMEENKLYDFALSDVEDEKIIERFGEAKVPLRMKEYVKEVCISLKTPLAVRSSSLLEDSYYQPFAGVYSTFMVPNNHEDFNVRCHQLEQAVKSVYASVFLKDSKAYIAATSNAIDEEKMGVVIQEITGCSYGDRFYPTFSGVARSVNFYPIEPEGYDDGIANIAFGLGKTTVEGGLSLRFCPKYPKKVLQLSVPEIALRDTQKEFYALDLDPNKFKSSLDDTVNLLKLKVRQAEKDNALKFVASTFDYQDHMLRDGIQEGGKKLITFSNILKYDSFPLAEMLQELLRVGEKEMNNQVEIEFSVNMDTPKDKLKVFHFLQIRPIVAAKEKYKIDFDEYTDDDLIVSSNMCLGNGVIDNICDVVYIKPNMFNPADTKLIAEVIDKINTEFVKKGKNYILIGPGRWGSNDPWLGVPVKWAQISAARLIIEAGLKNYQIDPSQGTHFFQNLTSFNVGYFTINPFINDGLYDVYFLSQQKVIYDDKYVSHVQLDGPAMIKIDGSKGRGIVCKPGVNINSQKQ